MPPDVWALRGRLQLPADKKAGRRSVFAPIVGANALAVAVRREFRLLLDRRDLDVLWSGKLETALPVSWCGDDLHLVDDSRRLLVWDSVTQTQKWSAAGAGRGHGVWKALVVLMPAPGRLEMHEARSGRIARELGINGNANGFQVFDDLAVLFFDDDHLEGLDLSVGESTWSVALREAYGHLSPQGREPLKLALGRDTSSLVLHWRPGLGVLDLASGRFRWKRELRVDASPLVANGRVAMLGGGHLFMCDDVTGQTIVDSPGATPTLWECPPTTHEGTMVIVDEQGYIVTIALSDGAIVGLQKEKGAGFMGCVSVDGRLLVGGLDGALWVYEPAQQTPGRAEGRSTKASAGKQQPTPDDSPRPARGRKSTGRARSAAKAKRR
jgi:hypothetical protein